MRLCLQLFLRTDNQKTLYLCIFNISTICSNHQADTIGVKYVQKTLAGTGLGSCISWILHLVHFKSAILCLIKSKHFQQVIKWESSEAKGEVQASTLPPELYI